MSMCEHMCVRALCMGVSVRACVSLCEPVCVWGGECVCECGCWALTLSCPQKFLELSSLLISWEKLPPPAPGGGGGPRNSVGRWLLRPLGVCIKVQLVLV